MSDQGTLAPERLPSSATMAHFHALRGRLLDVVSRARQLSAAFGSQAATIEHSFQPVRVAVELSQLNLVVIGAEGHGKSTLLNAVLGTELSPREMHHPGTVAPTFLEYGDTPAPQFYVKIGGDEDLRPLQDLHEFRSYVLQSQNPENEKHVEWGVVRAQHPLLAQGLRLVDLPGVEGVSVEVSRLAKHFIKYQAPTVVAVFKDREYGAVVRMLEQFDRQIQSLCAIVNNPSKEFFEEGSIEENIRTRTQAAVKHLKLDPAEAERIVVLHLPSVCEQRVNRPGFVTDPAHAAEVGRFDSLIWRHVAANGCVSVIGNGTREAERALHALAVRCAFRRDVLRGVVDGDEATRQSLREKFAAAREAADAEWATVNNPDTVEAMAVKPWESIRSAARAARETVLSAVNRLEAKVASIEGRVSREQGDNWKRELQTEIDRSLDQVDDTTRSAANHVLADACAHATQSLATIYARVPLLDATVAAERIVILPDEIARYQLGQLDNSQLEKFLKAGAVGTGGVLAGVVSGGSGIAVLTLVGMNPIGAAIAGATAGVLGSWALYEWFLGGSRAPFTRELNKCRDQMGSIDTSSNGALYRNWQEQVRSLVSVVDVYRREQILQMEALIRADQSPEKMRRDLAATMTTLEQIDRLQEELTQIDSDV